VRSGWNELTREARLHGWFSVIESVVASGALVRFFVGQPQTSWGGSRHDVVARIELGCLLAETVAQLVEGGRREGVGIVPVRPARS